MLSIITISSLSAIVAEPKVVLTHYVPGVRGVAMCVLVPGGVCLQVAKLKKKCRLSLVNALLREKLCLSNCVILALKLSCTVAIELGGCLCARLRSDSIFLKNARIQNS
mmetsp:Transcript_75553/g.119294  ORF Transcript_75553/g.119294 Transcript_75553/m.119294 type:complete len:109 (-) Transcript_75553:59-385(-)